MTTNKKLTINSAGKINLYLNVSKNLRPDGYHEIKSIMQSVSLYDELHFEVCRNNDISESDGIDNGEVVGNDGDCESNCNYSGSRDSLAGSIKANNAGSTGISKDSGSHKTCNGSLSGEKSIMISCNNIGIPLNEKNLVHKAAYLVMKKYNLGKKYNIRINISKRIPVGAGFAGGSMNARATLFTAQALF